MTDETTQAGVSPEMDENALASAFEDLPESGEQAQPTQEQAEPEAE